MKISGFHEGDRSEFLAEFALSTIGLCVPVPRPSDYFLTDFLVHLTAQKKQMLELLGLSFAIQIKSDDADIPVKGQDQLRVFFKGMTPFFVGVVSKEGAKMELFTTIHRLLVPEKFRSKKWTLKHGGNHHQIDFKSRTLYLGPAIAEIDLRRLDVPEHKQAERKLFRQVMMSWVMLETVSATGSFMNMPWIAVPEISYAKNVPVPVGDYAYKHVVDRQKANMVVKAAELWLVALSSYLTECLPELEGIPGLMTNLKSLHSSLSLASSVVKDQVESKVR